MSAPPLLEFAECAQCAAQIGSPTLCAACTHNRGLVQQLKAELRRQHREHRQTRKFLREVLSVLVSELGEEE